MIAMQYLPAPKPKKEFLRAYLPRELYAELRKRCGNRDMSRQVEDAIRNYLLVEERATDENRYALQSELVAVEAEKKKLELRSEFLNAELRRLDVRLNALHELVAEKVRDLQAQFAENEFSDLPSLRSRVRSYASILCSRGAKISEQELFALAFPNGAPQQDHLGRWISSETNKKTEDKTWQTNHSYP